MADTEHDKTPYLLWLDLETTGTDPEVDHIIEFAVILTDSSTLEEIGRTRSPINPWHGAFTEPFSVRLFAEQFCGTPVEVLTMHDASGLWDEVQASTATVDDVDWNVTAWLDATVSEKAIAIAGSGVSHFDMRFIQAQMPKLAKMVRYWQVDVGVLRRVDALWGGPGIATRNEDKPHRAMADAEIHLADARAWREYLLAGLNAEEPRS